MLLVIRSDGLYWLPRLYVYLLNEIRIIRHIYLVLSSRPQYLTNLFLLLLILYYIILTIIYRLGLVSFLYIIG